MGWTRHRGVAVAESSRSRHSFGPISAKAKWRSRRGVVAEPSRSRVALPPFLVHQNGGVVAESLETDLCDLQLVLFFVGQIGGVVAESYVFIGMSIPG